MVGKNGIRTADVCPVGLTAAGGWAALKEYHLVTYETYKEMLGKRDITHLGGGGAFYV